MGLRHAVLAVTMLAGCNGLGVCVSEPVEYTTGLRVYCYDEWDRADCTEYDDEEVNGASWEFHPGQTCADRDLVNGGNDWP